MKYALALVAVVALLPASAPAAGPTLSKASADAVAKRSLAALAKRQKPALSKWTFACRRAAAARFACSGKTEQPPGRGSDDGVKRCELAFTVRRAAGKVTSSLDGLSWPWKRCIQNGVTIEW